eukprot:CAMPEP_0115879822 /NCGR_PEP_ID=MMETSP0287-20121206/27530_1 /TAXON_ID=412157 /ORGANISM="Chrysochromulina rotalis, Strain UIO044" /LENGTH=127 /DNA_ID=CAMNT_0003335567 /DNA_START=201 /DNA_END=582 /DNA_ORIENTATION=+
MSSAVGPSILARTMTSRAQHVLAEACTFRRAAPMSCSMASEAHQARHATRLDDPSPIITAEPSLARRQCACIHPSGGGSLGAHRPVMLGEGTLTTLDRPNCCPRQLIGLLSLCRSDGSGCGSWVDTS